jgi:negative regulator of flagellin synthesis FlgM
MKIENNLKSISSGPATEDAGRPSKKPAADSVAAPKGADVQLSSISENLRAIEKGFADTPVVDTARVNEIKQAISSGQFKVDAEKVADRLLKTVQELINAHKA